MGPILSSHVRTWGTFETVPLFFRSFSMARFKVLSRSFINNRTCDPGDIVEYDGVPAENLEPMDKEAKAATADAKASGVPTAVPEDFNPQLGISDVKQAVAGTSAAQPGGEVKGDPAAAATA
jgi:hypothetical protein